MNGERGLVRFLRRFPAVWITLAVAVVGMAVVGRSQPAKPMDYSDSLPMRNLTPQEAAALLETGDRLARIGDSSVDLITSRRLVPLTSPKGTTILIRRGSRLWEPKNAGARSSDLALRYRLDRAPLERALGGRPLATFLDPKAGSRKLSFSSERMPLYAAFEVALFWAIFLLFWLIVRYLRPRTLILPVLLVLGIALLFAIQGYAPALTDDGFYQRWAVEQISLPLLVFLFPLAVLSGLSLLGLIGTGVLWLARRGKGTLQPAHWAAAVLVPIALVVLACFAVDRTSAARERRSLDAASRAIHFEDSEAVLAEARALLGKSGRHCFGGDQYCSKIGDLPPHLRRFVTDTLAGVPEMPDSCWVGILVPVSEEDYLFFFGGPRFTFADFRSAPSYGVDIMLRTKRPFRTDFVTELLHLLMGRGANRFNARPVLRADGRVGAIVYTESQNL
ncbi:MAG: hypothetical protein WAM82_22150 [Thermoanaerobaculia bacterium]